MIEKLKQNNRIEFMLKENRINNRFYNMRIVHYMFGFTGLILMGLNLFDAGILSFILFLIFCLIDNIMLKKSKSKLFGEYFEVKPKEKNK